MELAKVKNRDFSLDAIAGFFIILMIFQHFNINTRAPYTLGHVFMFNTSWFFFKSGMFHKPQKYNQNLILKWGKRFLVPFIIFSIIGVTIQLIVEPHPNENPFIVYYGMFAQIAHYGSPWWNIPLWFLLSMFIVKVTTASYAGGDLSTFIYLAIALGIAVLHHYYISNDFNYLGNTALGVIFYILGYKSKSWSISIFGWITIILLFCASILIIPTAFDIWSNSALYGNYFLAIFGASCGMVIVNKLFNICKFLQLKPFIFFGQNAMLFLICHVPIALAVRSVCSNYIVETTLIPWIEATITIPVCLLLCLFFDRRPRLRWVIGG